MSEYLYSVMVSYERVELTLQAIESYLETVTLPHTLMVVDNGSCLETTNTLRTLELQLLGSGSFLEVKLLGHNHYPGYATNRGWEQMPPQTTHLHRADNDFAYHHGWCDEFLKAFATDPQVGQVGLRTGAEEDYVSINVGGNNVILRELWDQGLRYDERPWGRKYPTGWTEDSLFSPAVVRLGYRWVRVERPCIRSLEAADLSKPYYQETFKVRRILPR